MLSPEAKKAKKSKLRELEALHERAQKKGEDVDEAKYRRLMRKVQEELDADEIPVHPALVFGPVSQTVATMCAMSMVMSTTPLPYEMLAFYKVFSAMSVIAMSCLVVRNSIIYYGYSQALANLPKPPDKRLEQDAKWKKMMETKPARQDDWEHARSHPSHFLTTRDAPPRIFPFPLGKTSAKATVADELWWEGGNAPHVGHYKKRELPPPKGPDKKALMAKVKVKMEMEALETLIERVSKWKKRIKSIQMICVIVMVSFFNRKIAVILLVYTIYQTLTSELDAILAPPLSTTRIEGEIDKYAKYNVQPHMVTSALFPYGVQGMAHVYSPDDVLVGGGKDNARIPIMSVPPPVLMTTTSEYLSGVGEDRSRE